MPCEIDFSFLLLVIGVTPIVVLCLYVVTRIVTAAFFRSYHEHQRRSTKNGISRP
jgi:hypothetical protein